MSVKPIDRESKHTPVFVCQFQHHGQLHSVIFLRAAFWNCRSKAITKVLMSIYIFFRKVLMWHIYPQNALRNMKTHTWGQIHISCWCKIITALTGLSSPHITLPSPQFLIWFDVWIMWCDVHIFRGEAGLCLLSHRVTTGEMMTRAPGLAESSNKCSLTPAPRKVCNISRSAGTCILGLVWWMNHFLSSVSQNTLYPKAGLWRTSNTDRDVKRGENINSAVMNIWKASSGRNMLRERESDLCWMSSRNISLGLMHVHRHHFKKNDNLTLLHRSLFVSPPVSLSLSHFSLNLF